MDYAPPKTPPAYVDPRDYQAQQVRDFLKKMSFIESTNGQNTDHATMPVGLHEGTHAVGEYGIMPLTAQDLDRQYGTNQLQDMDKLDVQKKLEQNPDLQDRLAATLASKLLKNNDSDKAAYKWEYGQYSSPSDAKVESSDRVRKFRVLGSSNEK